MSDDVVRGEEAKRILDSSVFKDAMDTLRGGVIGQLNKVPIAGDTATIAQQQMIMLLQVSTKFEKIIQDVISTGKLSLVDKKGNIA
jgi:hypothetical protein